MCDYNCFNCKYHDCIVDEMTDKERAEQKERDREINPRSVNNYESRKAYYQAYYDKVKKKAIEKQAKIDARRELLRQKRKKAIPSYDVFKVVCEKVKRDYEQSIQ